MSKRTTAVLGTIVATIALGASTGSALAGNGDGKGNADGKGASGAAPAAQSHAATRQPHQAR
jgi:hypothetical protein